MRLVPAQRPLEPGGRCSQIFATSMLNWTFPYPHSGVATARVAHGCGSDLRLPEQEFCSADIPTRLTPIRPASRSAYDIGGRWAFPQCVSVQGCSAGHTWCWRSMSSG
jgi:hypothetical protein